MKTRFASRPDLAGWLEEPGAPTRPGTPGKPPPPGRSGPPRTSGTAEPSRSRVALEWMVVFAAATLITLVVQLTTAQVYAIPSASMTPTLEVGDRVLVNKWAYRFGDPRRGDIVVFTRPKGAEDVDDDLIKRVIALPGETVTIADNHVLVDGIALDEPYLAQGTLTQPVGDHLCTPEAPCVVPEGHLWVMGDNRNNSVDSRYFDAIPISSVVGQAVLRVWPVSRFGSLDPPAPS